MFVIQFTFIDGNGVDQEAINKWQLIYKSTGAIGLVEFRKFVRREYDASFEYKELAMYDSGGIISVKIVFPDLERKIEFYFKHC